MASVNGLNNVAIIATPMMLDGSSLVGGNNALGFSAWGTPLLQGIVGGTPEALKKLAGLQLKALDDGKISFKELKKIHEEIDKELEKGNVFLTSESSLLFLLGYRRTSIHRATKPG